MQARVTSAAKIQGTVSVPGDKSISHRAIMLGAIARGDTLISGFLQADDCLHTVNCFRQLGVNIEINGEQVLVHGKGLEGLTEPVDVLNVGNSGTTIRLLLGLLAGQPFCTILTGDASIRRRPMRRVVQPLTEMGAKIMGRQGASLAPLAISGNILRPIDYTLPVASAQVKSALLLAGLYADGVTRLVEPNYSRDHTERMLQYLGAEIKRDGFAITLKGRQLLEAQKIEVPGDISSAAFLMVAAAITPGADLIIKNVGMNPTRMGIIDVLRQMGAKIEIIAQNKTNVEPVADLRITGSDLQGVTIQGEIIPRLIDEIPILAVAALFAEGKTVIRDAEELKYKETNRITAIVRELTKLGADITELPDGISINGKQKLHGAVCESHYDHRIAMALAVAGLRIQDLVIINDAECVRISFPGFFDILQKISR